MRLDRTLLKIALLVATALRLVLDSLEPDWQDASGPAPVSGDLRLSGFDALTLPLRFLPSQAEIHVQHELAGTVFAHEFAFFDARDPDLVLTCVLDEPDGRGADCPEKTVKGPDENLLDLAVVDVLPHLLDAGRAQARAAAAGATSGGRRAGARPCGR